MITIPRQGAAPLAILVALTAPMAGCEPPSDASATAAPADTADGPAPVVASVDLEGIADVELGGELTLRQVGDFVRIDGSVHGLSDGKHGLHVHEGASCSERGGHFAPAGHPHGSPDEPSMHRHAGDLGNLVSEGDTARYHRVDATVKLTGPGSALGHVLVIHRGEDAYLPQPSGSAGDEIGCGVIRETGGRG